MSKDIQAFTVYGKGLLPVLITNVNVRHAETHINYTEEKKEKSNILNHLFKLERKSLTQVHMDVNISDQMLGKKAKYLQGDGGE